MDCVLVGFKPVTYTFKDGRSVDGFRLFVMVQDDKAVGTACDNLFISQQRLGGINLNDTLEHKVRVNYNKYGKVQSLQVGQ